jgi:hypothetical protein
MPCKYHKDALVEAAATGAVPQGELRAHLAACADCRAAFEQEQALFSTIDAGLYFTANSEVPASLLPRVRAGLEGEVTSKRSWAADWLVLASAAAIIAAFFTTWVIWHPDVRQNPPANSARANPSGPVAPRAQEQSKNRELPAENPSHLQLRIARSGDSQKRGGHAVHSSMPEVLVPRDQEILLAEYAEQWHLRERAPLVTHDSDATILVPLQVAQIQIAELDVKLLADEKSN